MQEINRIGVHYNVVVDPTGFRNGKKAVIFVSQNSNGKKCDYGKKPEKR